VILIINNIMLIKEEQPIEEIKEFISYNKNRLDELLKSILKEQNIKKNNYVIVYKNNKLDELIESILKEQNHKENNHVQGDK
jgi:predicted Holliday junction resolvase-like endonuclease